MLDLSEKQLIIKLCFKMYFFDTGWLDDQGRLQVVLERVDQKGTLGPFLGGLLCFSTILVTF